MKMHAFSTTQIILNWFILIPSFQCLQKIIGPKGTLVHTGSNGVQMAIQGKRKNSPFCFEYVLPEWRLDIEIRD